MPIVLTLIIILLANSPSIRADTLAFQENWQPNEYRVACQDGGCILDSEDQQYVTDMLKTAVADVQKTQFLTPTWWANRRTDASSGQEYIELLDSGKNNEAFVSCIPDQTSERGAMTGAVLNVGGKFEYLRDYGAHHMSYSHLVHEVFHLSQYEYPFYDPSRCSDHGGVPGWLSESTAQAVGVHMMIRKYRSDWPPKRSESEVIELAGLRRYDKSLLVQIKNDDGGEVKSGHPEFYRTHAFWRHLAEAHHGGKIDYLAKYMKRPQPAGGTWLSWLDQNTQKVTGMPLGIVFSGFLADYAGWGDRGHAGQLLGRKKWLTGAFRGCKTVYLNKAEPADYVETELYPVAGDCIEVVVPAMGENGVAEGESAAVQVAAMVMAGPPSSRGGIHLALASSNDKRAFHCAGEVKRKRKNGLGKCLFTPDDGRIRLGGGEVDARVWEVVAQEPSRKDRSGELKNLYTVSYTPTSLSLRDTAYGNDDSIFVRIYFVLDVAKVEVENQAKAGAVGTVGTPSADPQTTLSKRDASGRIVNSYSKPDAFQVAFAAPPLGGLPPQAEGKLGYFTVSTSADNADGNTLAVVMFARENARGQLESHALSVGETGSFPALIEAGLEQEPAVSLDDATVEVEEFTDLVFRARYRGTLCRHKDLVPQRPGMPAEDPCRRPFPISGQIVKAFAGTRLPGRYMLVERTEGTEMYRKAAETAMAEWTTGGSDSEAPGGSPTAAGPSAGDGAALGDCACSCEERAETVRRGEELKARLDAGEDVEAGAVMALSRCQSQCQSDYLRCALAESRAEEAEKAARKAAKRDELRAQCDCGCEALSDMQTRVESLLQRVQGGDMTVMQEMQQLGECAATCQSEMMLCGAEGR